MKMHPLALLCIGILCCGSLPVSQSVSAEEAEIPSVEMELCEAIQNVPEPEAKITGTISIIVREHPVHINITKHSNENPILYYDTELMPQEDGSAKRYIFWVNQSELPTDPSYEFGEYAYTSQLSEHTYSSSYTVTLSVPKTEENVYKESSVVILDTHEEAHITGGTHYTYDISFSEEMNEPYALLDSSAEINAENSTANARRSICLLWKPYTLGDIDNNDAINMEDAFGILTYYAHLAAGSTPPDNIRPEAADVDKDGAVTMDDAFLVLQYYSRLAAGHKETFEDFLARSLSS